MDWRQEEIVMSYTDGKLGLTSAQATLSRGEQIDSLLQLADHLQSILVPVRPDTRFRRRLHGELVLHGQAQQAEARPGLLRQHRKGIIIGAALGSAASVAGGVTIAFLLRHRHVG